MSNKFKTLSLVLPTLVIGSSIVAPSASASVFHLSAESTILTGEAIETQVIEATPENFLSFSCTKVSAVESTVTGKTVEELTIKPQYEECTSKNGEAVVAAFVDMTSCAYRLTAGTSEEHAKMRIECPTEGDKIHLRVTALKLICQHIPAQEVSGLHYQTTGETTEFEQKTVDVHVTIEGLVTSTVNSVACPTESGEEEVHNNGLYSGAFKLKADNTINEPTDISYG
jgi:hypothetical protein